MCDNEDNVQRVVMSHDVAREYLENKSFLGRSMTVFYTHRETRRKLLDKVSHVEPSYSEAFDHVTFTLEHEAQLKALKRACEALDLAYDLV